MKISTRARYGLRMVIELARELKKNDLVHLGKIAQITGLSENYLAQLAIPLKNSGLLIGVSGKKGGYHLARPPENITVGDVVNAVIGPATLTDCVSHPDVCLNSSFCEARIIWTILSGRISQTLEEYTIADLIDKDTVSNIKREYSDMPLIDPDQVMSEEIDSGAPGSPTKTIK